MIIIPYIIAFETNNKKGVFYDIFILFPIIFLSVDIALNFVTGYFSKGIWITEYKKIAYHYFKNFFFVDLITLIP